MRKKKMKEVDITLISRINRMLGKGIFSVEVGFDALALGARAVRDLFYTCASRASKLADEEGDMKETFERVDSFVDSALRR